MSLKTFADVIDVAGGERIVSMLVIKERLYIATTAKVFEMVEGRLHEMVFEWKSENE